VHEVRFAPLDTPKRDLAKERLGIGHGRRGH